MLSEQELDDKINIILRQTNYTETEARFQLQQCQLDHIMVIKKFLGVSLTTKIVKPISLNQETYKQIRLQLDSGVREFNQRTQKKE